MKKLILILFLLVQVFSVSSQQWIPDTNKKFSLRYISAYGSSMLSVSDTLYLGGYFDGVGAVNALSIARYYNGNWYPLKGGMNGSPNSFLFNIGNLYVSGSFGWADNKPGTMGLARWDGNNWWPIGSNSDCAGGGVLELYQNKIFVAGNIPAINSDTPVIAYNVAYFNGTNWVTAGNTNLPPLTNIKRNNSDLLATYYSNGFIKYEGDTTWSWNPYGGCSDYFKMEKDTINDFLYVAGDFAYICTNPPLISYGIAMWDGFEWHSFGTDLMASAGPLKVYNGHLYSGMGTDTLSNGLQVNYIARWDDTQWSTLGTGLNGGVGALEEFHDTLFVTGGFTTAGGDSAYGLARWYMPDTNCAFLQPTIHTLALQDTFYLSAGQVNVQFFNNNSYAQSWQWNFGDSGTGNTQNPIHTFTNDTAYTITVTVTEDGCIKSDTATIWVLSGGGNEEYTIENLNFKVYPNPTSGDFTIECTLPPNKTGAIQAYRLDGSQLGKKELEPGCNHLIMPASKWNAANVILVGVFIDGRQAFVEKVVKMQ